MKRARPCVQNLLRILRWYQQSIKPSHGSLLGSGALCDHRGHHTPMKPSLLPGFWSRCLVRLGNSQRWKNPEETHLEWSQKGENGEFCLRPKGVISRRQMVLGLVLRRKFRAGSPRHRACWSPKSVPGPKFTAELANRPQVASFQFPLWVQPLAPPACCHLDTCCFSWEWLAPISPKFKR